DDAEVPQGIEETVQKPLVGGADRALKENEQVDVRPETQLTPAVPAERDGRHRLRRRRGRVEQLTKQRIDARRVAAERPAAADAARRGLAQLLPRRFERVSGRG